MLILEIETRDRVVDLEWLLCGKNFAVHCKNTCEKMGKFLKEEIDCFVNAWNLVG